MVFVYYCELNSQASTTFIVLKVNYIEQSQVTSTAQARGALSMVTTSKDTDCFWLPN